MPVDWLDVSTTTPRIAYTATASQTDFVIPFVFHDTDHIKVYVNDVLISASDYTITGADDEDGGDLVFDTWLSASDSVVIVREVPYELTTHIPPSGPLDIPAVNLQLSLFVMMLQQAITDWTRSIRQPASDEEDLDALPVAASRASKYLYFDADGQPTVVASVSTSVAASAFMLTLLDDTTAAAARATLGITDQSSYVGLANWQHCR